MLQLTGTRGSGGDDGAGWFRRMTRIILLCRRAVGTGILLPLTAMRELVLVLLVTLRRVLTLTIATRNGVASVIHAIMLVIVL